jgi:hypothetical protein
MKLKARCTPSYLPVVAAVKLKSEHTFSYFNGYNKKQYVPLF